MTIAEAGALSVVGTMALVRSLMLPVGSLADFESSVGKTAEFGGEQAPRSRQHARRTEVARSVRGFVVTLA
jgi:hypothetical protein